PVVPARRPPPPPPLVPYTTLFRSVAPTARAQQRLQHLPRDARPAQRTERVAAVGAARIHHRDRRRQRRTRRVMIRDDNVDAERQDRKSTRLNSSHVKTSYAVFCSK